MREGVWLSGELRAKRWEEIVIIRDVDHSAHEGNRTLRSPCVWSDSAAVGKCRTVRVAAIDGQLSIGRGADDFEKGIAHGFAGEMREPFVVGSLAFVPAGIAHRRHMRAENHVRVFGERRRKHAANVLGGEVAKFFQLGDRNCSVSGANSAMRR